MRLVRRRSSAPLTTTVRPAEPYLIAGAEEARRLGHNVVGTEHVLLVLLRDPAGGATRILERLGVSADAVEAALGPCLGGTSPSIDPDALAALGIDLGSVRDRLEQTFGPGALERTGSGCLGVAPRLKQALAHAVDRADGDQVDDEHVLLGMLSVPDSLASHVLTRLGVSLEAVSAVAGNPG